MDLYKTQSKKVTDNILISIILPVYNAERYIKKCLLSIQNQTYRNLEIIIINDGSEDNSIQICQEIAKDDPRISIHSQKNGGSSSARNHGLNLATGDYIYFIDSDDFISHTCIERLVQLVFKYPGVTIVQGGVKTDHQPSPRTYNRKYTPEYSSDRKWIKKAILRRKPIPVTPWNKLIRLDFIRKYDLYFINGVRHEDEAWTYHLAKHVRTIAFYFEDTYFYNVNNPNSVMHLCHRLDAHSWIIILDNFIQNIDPFCKKAQKKLIFHLLRKIYRECEISYRPDLIILFHQMAQKSTFAERLGIYYFFFTQKDLCKYMHLSSRKDKL
jgi:glycosyltransferase involved in cell wall biosynthesis